jgi:hypothetical protein
MRSNGVSPHDPDALNRIQWGRICPNVSSFAWAKGKGFAEYVELVVAYQGQGRQSEWSYRWNPQVGLNNEVSPDDKKLPPDFQKVASIPVSPHSPEERKKDVDDVMTWMCSKKPNSLDLTGDFKNFDQLLPKKKGQKPEDLVKESEGTLDWMKNKWVKPSDNNGDVPDFNKLGLIPVPTNKESLESDWNRQPLDKIPGVPDEELLCSSTFEFLSKKQKDNNNNCSVCWWLSGRKSA